MHACAHKQAFHSCTVTVNNRRTVLTSDAHMHKLSFQCHPWLFLLLFQTAHQHHAHPYHSDIFLISSFHPFLFVPLPQSLTPVSPLLPPSLCRHASSQSVSEKCCCQLTFPITPPVAQTMDTLLTSGDRAERERNLKWSTRAISLSLTHLLSLTTVAFLSYASFPTLSVCMSICDLIYCKNCRVAHGSQKKVIHLLITRKPDFNFTYISEHTIQRQIPLYIFTIL